METSKFNLPHVPNEGQFWLKCTVLSGTSHCFIFLKFLVLQYYVYLPQVLIVHICDVRYLYLICDPQGLKLFATVFLGDPACKYCFCWWRLVGSTNSDLIHPGVSSLWYSRISMISCEHISMNWLGYFWLCQRHHVLLVPWQLFIL